MKKILAFILVTGFVFWAYAGDVYNPLSGSFDKILTIQEEDGSPSIGTATVLKVNNATLTDNGDGTMSIVFPGAAGGDSISIDSVAVVDPDFVSTGDIDFVDTSNTVTANLNASTISGKADTTIASADYMLFWDVTDSLLKKVDVAELLGGSGDLKADGTIPLTANWDVGAYTITTAGIIVGDGQTTGAATNKWLFDDTGGDISCTGKVGIGTTSPGGYLHVLGGANTIMLERVCGDSGPPEVVGRKARGSVGSRTAVLDEDRLWFFAAQGYAGTEGAGGAYSENKVGMEFKAAENFTDIAQGTYISFLTTAIGGTTRTEKMHIEDNGRVGIGSSSPDVDLDVEGSTGISIGENKAGGSSNDEGILKLWSDGDNAYSTVVKTGTQTQSNTYTLPLNDGDNLEVLHTNGAGVLSWSTDDSAGSTALDDIGDPDAPTSISMADNEAITLTSAEDTGTVLTINMTDADMAGDTFGLDIIHAGDANSVYQFMRCYDNTNDLQFLIASNGNVTGGTLTSRSWMLNEGGNYISQRLSDSPTIVPEVTLRRARDGDPTSNVSDDDYLGQVAFEGYHTDGYDTGATIRTIVDGTPGNTDMPARMEFLVSPDASATPVLALTINNAGNFNFADGNLTTTGTFEAATLTEGGNALYNATETPGGELGGTFSSFTIDDNITVTGWVLGASTATTAGADDNDTSLATTAFCETTQDYLKTSEHTGFVTNDAADTIAGALTINPGTLFIQEQADASADVVGQGQLWVNTATPNELWWTNDAGTDKQLGTAGATADISDVNVTQTELAELETIGATTISANQWATLGGIADTLSSAELNLLDGISTLSGENTGDNTVATTGDSATAFFNAGTIEHERGGLEADVNAYTGLIGINGGSTSEVDTEAELETHLGGLDVVCVTADDITSANLASIINGETGTGNPVFGTSPTIATPTITGNIKSEPKHLIFTIIDPLTTQTEDNEICIWPVTPAAITVTKIVVTLDAAANEVLGDLKFADAFIGLANATVVESFDTTNGVRSDEAMSGDATIPSGKCIYIAFDSAPDTAIHQMSVDITYDYD